MDEDFLEAHASEDLVSHHDRTVVIRILLVVHPCQDCLSEEIVLESLVLVVLEGHCLLIICCGGPLLVCLVGISERWVHPEELLCSHRRDAWVWNKLNERKLVEACKVPDRWTATGVAVVSLDVDEWIHVDASVAGEGESFLVLERLASNFKSFNLNLERPLGWDFESL